MTSITKLKKNQGFSLTELLVATMILLLLTMVVSGGVNLALREYQRSVFISESNVLSSTINVSLADMLRYAHYVNDEDEQPIFTNSAYAINEGSLSIADGNVKNPDGSARIAKGQLCYLPYATAENDELRVLVNSGAYTSIEVERFEMKYDPTTYTFFGKYLLRSTEVSSLSSEYTFVVKSLYEELMAERTRPNEEIIAKKAFGDLDFGEIIMALKNDEVLKVVGRINSGSPNTGTFTQKTKLIDMLNNRGIFLGDYNINSWVIRDIDAGKLFILWTEIDINTVSAGTKVKVMRYNENLNTYTAGYAVVATQTENNVTFNTLNPDSLWTEYKGKINGVKQNDTTKASFNTTLPYYFQAPDYLQLY